MKKNTTITTREGVTTTPKGFLKIEEIKKLVRDGEPLSKWNSSPYFWVGLNMTHLIKTHQWVFENGRLYLFSGDFTVILKEGDKTRSYAGKKGLALLRTLCLPVVENW